MLYCVRAKKFFATPLKETLCAVVALLSMTTHGGREFREFREISETEPQSP